MRLIFIDSRDTLSGILALQFPYADPLERVRAAAGRAQPPSVTPPVAVLIVGLAHILRGAVPPVFSEAPAANSSVYPATQPTT